jgi:hypothetical protein
LDLGPSGARPFGSLAWRRRNRDDAREAARSPAPHRLVPWISDLLLDLLLELGEPIFHRPLDLRSRRPWFFRPDSRPIGPDGFWRRIGVGGLGLDGDVRREFGHHRQC